MTDIRISEPALDELKSLPADVRERIKDKLLNDVAGDPSRHIKQLTNSPHGRVRVGDYRIIVEYDRDADEVRVHDVGHRRNIYDWLRPDRAAEAPSPARTAETPLQPRLTHRVRSRNRRPRHPHPSPSRRAEPERDLQTLTEDEGRVTARKVGNAKLWRLVKGVDGLAERIRAQLPKEVEDADAEAVVAIAEFLRDEPEGWASSKEIREAIHADHPAGKENPE